MLKLAELMALGVPEDESQTFSEGKGVETLFRVVLLQVHRLNRRRPSQKVKVLKPILIW